MSVTITLHYAERGSVLIAEFLCDGDPGPLESGNRGWFAVSDELDWHCGWRLKVQCPITEPKGGYGYPAPPAAKQRYGFEEKYYGDLLVDGRNITVRFGIPDCLDPPKRSFNWGQPILINGKMFHCALQLQIRPRAGGHLRRKAASMDRAGGIVFLSSNRGTDNVIGFVKDSERGRGRDERIFAYCHEHRSEYEIGTPYTDSRDRITQPVNASKWMAAW